MDNIIGKKLDGRYEIQEIIGIGGMAVVYKAYDCIDDRIVAVKILKDEYLKNDEFRRRFKNESKAVAVLSHPNIVKVYDVSFGDRIQYIVMEYIDGITLKEYIDQQKVLTWKETVHFAVQILRALSHAHERGIVHRDIKPQNIMMLEDGTIKVTDFGIARFAHSETHTMTDKAIGSVHYISPEQARGSLTDEKSDIYSVGVMLYEMLTGTLPFQSDSAVSVAIMQMQETPKKPSEINPDIPEGLEEITLKAMQKDPEQRYQSASEMLDDIERFKENPSIRFQYKYFVDDAPTKYVDAINEVKGEDKTSNDPKAALAKNGKKGKKKLKKSDYLPILAGIAGAVVVLVVLVVIFMFLFKGGWNSSNVAVPNLVGMQLEAAQKQYPDFIITKKNTVYDPEAPEGQILKQTPDKGTQIKEKGEIQVTVSLGQQKLSVPDVSGKNQTDAESAIKGAGFTNVTTTEEFSDAPAGTVIGTSPAAGETAGSNDQITIRLSKGKDSSQLATVPNVVGLTKDQATRNIQDANLTASASEAYSDSVAAGVVISQAIPANSQVAQKATVAFVVSKGKQPASSAPASSSEAKKYQVPQVRGLSPAKAQEEIVSAGLTFGKAIQIEDTSVAEGSVVRATPSEGSTVAKGATVNIYVAKAPASSENNGNGNKQ